MKKRSISLLLAIVMLISMLPVLPVQTYAAEIGYNANSRFNAMVTVRDSETNAAITNATVTVTRVNNTYEVYNAGDGQYKFTKDSNGWNTTYTIAVSADGYEPNDTTLRGYYSSATVELDPVRDYVPGSALNTVITVTAASSADVKISDAAVTVSRGGNAYEVVNLGNGQYAFTRAENNSSHSYTVTAVANGYTTNTVTVRGNSAEAAISLTGMGIVTFDVYYIANGVVPDSYQGAGDAKNYGPSADNTALVQIDVNLDMLRELAAQTNSPVVYLTAGNGGVNNYEFIPAGSRADTDHLAKVQAFWNAVLTCTAAESIEALNATGLGDDFMAYCLKNQGSANNPDCHADGVLKVAEEATSYVVELYKDQVYFGGSVTDSEEKKFPTRLSILEQYETHLGKNITWVEDGTGMPALVDGVFTGTYVETDAQGNRWLHTVTIQQRENSKSQTIEGSEIPYVMQTEHYYLAQFDLADVKGEQIEYLVTYTDGLPNEVLFTDHEYRAEKNQQVPAFAGSTAREDYTFQGWYLEGSDSDKVYTDAEIAQMTVTSNMTFHAVWQAIPKYTGRVNIVLNGKYDTTTQTITEGTYVDPSELGSHTDVLYVSRDGTEHIQMIREAAGQYSAVLENGTYHMYVKTGDVYELASNQPLIMENQDRTRWLFFNSVTYDPNGGTLDGKESRVEYYVEGTAVDVYATAPVREGYIFLGWESKHGTYQPGELLDATIDHACTLVAQWVKARNVYVNVTLDHTASNHVENPADDKHNVTFTLDTRPVGSAGDYTEVYSGTILWDGTSEFTRTDYSASVATGDTVYTAKQPNRTNVRSDYEYTVTSAKSGYDLTSVTQETDTNGDLHITVVMKYNPDDFDFTYTVELDDAAKALPTDLWPEAVNVKVTYWNSVSKSWTPIGHHANTYERVAIDETTGTGSGSYPVWATKTDGTHYYYRIEVVSYELKDGTVVAAAMDANEEYTTEHKRFFTKVNVTNGADPVSDDSNTWTGAYYQNSAQVGTVKGIVRIPVYNVTFDPNGGKLTVDSTDYTTASKYVLTQQIVMPDYSRYVPTKAGGYIFEGWELLDGTPVGSGEALVRDVELVAKWRDPITVEGLVTVAGTYEQEVDGVIHYQTILSHDLPQSVTVLLQKKQPSGYYETINQMTMTLNYADAAYYFNGRKVGHANYKFTALPNDGEYRIYVMVPNYHAAFQNEPESITAWAAYDTYIHDDSERIAVLGDTEPLTADVNAHLHFDPPSFELNYEVDASAIGEAFRPNTTDILITCDDNNPAQIYPSQWPVITQMILNGVETGKNTALTGGKGSGAVSVWKTSIDGTTEYDYGIRLQKVDGTAYAENDRYEVTYQSPAHFDETTNKQSQMLIVKLTPKTYAINYVTNGGTIFGTYTNTHTWSFETQLTEITPVRTGYEFLGWYTDEAMTQPLTATSIPADHAADTTYYAKWQQVMDDVYLQVIIDHTYWHSNDDKGITSSYEKDLVAQLTRRERGTAGDYLPVDGQVKSYDKSYWHTMPDKAYEQNENDVLAVPQIFSGLSSAYDYSLNVTMDGYYVSFDVTQDQVYNNDVLTAYTRVEKTPNADGSTTHHVYVYLQFEPEMMDLTFSVKMAEDVDKAQFIKAADVKVSCWYTPGTASGTAGWHPITQHTNKVVRVELDNGTGVGTGQYPVWQWLSTVPPVPYYYRMEVVALEMADGTVVTLTEKTADVTYTGGAYKADVLVTGGAIPQEVKNSAAVNANTTLTGVYGKTVTGDTNQVHQYQQSGTLEAVVDVGKVVFHANNTAYKGDDVFRTYYPAECTAPEGIYSLKDDGTVASFYEIPEFGYETHNEYIFAGWYTAEDGGEPISWNDVWTNAYDPQHVYAHWITTGEVAQEDDGKTGIPNGIYQGYDLTGTQIRTASLDELEHHGTVAPGMRFITAMSEKVYTDVNNLSGTAAEYGFVVARADTTAYFAGDDANYTLQYAGTNVNGKDTSADYYYVKNMKCSGVVDHFDGENYRLYTAVITYKGKTGDALKAAQDVEFVARSYMRYTDANGLLRTYYNNYTGTQVYSSCKTSWTQVNNILNPQQ